MLTFMLTLRLTVTSDDVRNIKQNTKDAFVSHVCCRCLSVVPSKAEMAKEKEIKLVVSRRKEITIKKKIKNLIYSVLV